jgi:glycosyltransferase involved in cell wall biosynthesis
MPHEEVPALLSHAAVLAHLPNYQEGLGGVVLEAMAMGVPVVAFDSGGVGECFVSGEHGFLVKQYDVDGAADRILRLASDEGLRKKFGAAARMHVAEAFSPSRHFAGIDAVYQSLLSRT